MIGERPTHNATSSAISGGPRAAVICAATAVAQTTEFSCLRKRTSRLGDGWRVSRRGSAGWWTGWLIGLLVSPLSVAVGLQNRQLALVATEPQQGETGSGLATLKTDPDTEAILEKAKRFLADGNYSVAAQLWQAVLERSGDTLYSRDERTYFSMVDQVEATLAKLEPEALKVYRINADAEAKQILARGGPENVVALNEVVRRYFVSSVGDEAAFDLAAIYLDRYDFLGALRLLKKIEERHPDPSIPRGPFLARLTLCQALVGEREAAGQGLAELRQLGGESVAQATQLEKMLAASPEQLSEEFGLMSLSSFREFRVQPGLPADYMTHDLAATWQFAYELSPQSVYQRENVEGKVQRLAAAELNDSTVAVGEKEKALLKDWREQLWRPTNGCLVSGGKVYFKTAADLVCWSTDLSEAPAWRSLWGNEFEPDDATSSLEMIRNNYGNAREFNTARGTRAPMSNEELLFFGDEIPNQLQRLGGVVYHLEGRRFDNAPLNRNNRRRGFQYNAAFRRTRTNFLVAYEADTGRLLWNLPKNNGTSLRPASEAGADGEQAPPVEQEEWLSSGGFMGAPLAYQDTLIVPVNLGGAIYIYGLDPAQNGKTLWRTYLCDEPESGAASWAPVTLTLDSSDLFVASGMGVIFVLDPANGTIRFAQRYPRQGVPSSMLRQFGWQMNRLEFDGWREDLIIPYGRQMICFCSDSKQIFAIDRSTAQLIWQVEMKPLGQKLDYVIGIQNDILFAGGPETIIAFDLLGEGRMLWGGDLLFGDGQILGRAVLCHDGLYVPVDDTIIKLDSKERGGQPRILARAHVATGHGGPCGSLSSDGTRLWMHSGPRLMALEPRVPSESPPKAHGEPLTTEDQAPDLTTSWRLTNSPPR